MYRGPNSSIGFSRTTPESQHETYDEGRERTREALVYGAKDDGSSCMPENPSGLRADEECCPGKRRIQPTREATLSLSLATISAIEKRIDQAKPTRDIDLLCFFSSGARFRALDRWIKPRACRNSWRLLAEFDFNVIEIEGPYLRVRCGAKLSSLENARKTEQNKGKKEGLRSWFTRETDDEYRENHPRTAAAAATIATAAVPVENEEYGTNRVRGRVEDGCNGYGARQGASLPRRCDEERSA